MKTHFAWRPHLEGGTLFNPFIPSERQSTLGHVTLSEAYGDDTQTEPEPPAPAANPPEPQAE